MRSSRVRGHDLQPGPEGRRVTATRAGSVRPRGRDASQVRRGGDVVPQGDARAALGHQRAGGREPVINAVSARVPPLHPQAGVPLVARSESAPTDRSPGRPTGSPSPHSVSPSPSHRPGLMVQPGAPCFWKARVLSTDTGKVVVNGAMSLDGFIAGPGHTMDWIFDFLTAAHSRKSWRPLVRRLSAEVPTRLPSRCPTRRATTTAEPSCPHPRASRPAAFEAAGLRDERARPQGRGRAADRLRDRLRLRRHAAGARLGLVGAP